MKVIFQTLSFWTDNEVIVNVFPYNKKISYNSKNSTSLPIYLIDFIDLSTLSIYLPHLLIDFIYLSIYYQTHLLYLFLLFLLHI